MPTVSEIYDYMDSFAPFRLQCEWDNSGLNIGDFQGQVSKIAVALDITPEAVAYAAEKGAQLIVSHHPVLYHARRQVLTNDPAYAVIRNGMSAICAHTCLDIAEGGVNDVLCRKLGFDNAVPLAQTGEAAMVRVYEYETPVTVADVAAQTAKKLGGAVRYSCGQKTVRRVAVCGGEGTDFIPDVKKAGCDLFITGDCRHHNFLDAEAMGLAIIAAGHYETENPVTELLAEKLRERFAVEVFLVPGESPCQTVQANND